MNGFDFHCRTRLVFGPGGVDRAGELTAELGGRRVLLVTDAGLIAAGHAHRVREILLERAEAVTLFCDVHENPTTEDIAGAVAVANQTRPDLIVALGGGSAIDTAKAADMVHCSGGQIADYHGEVRIGSPLLPLIAIPTTAGTGSEVQRFALVSDARTHRKMACGDVKATPAVAILDPELTLTCPREVTIHAGVDALAHAVETAVTTRRSELSLTFSLRAAGGLLEHLPRVLAQPEDLEARAHVMWGATLAGLAIENSMLGAAHACANPLTARFGVVHGLAVAIMLPHVMAFNAQEPAALVAYSRLAEVLGIQTRGGSADAVMPWLLERVTEVLDAAEIKPSLRTLGIDAAALPDLAALAEQEWTGRFNPRPLSRDDFVALYEAAL